MTAPDSTLVRDLLSQLQQMVFLSATFQNDLLMRSQPVLFRKFVERRVDCLLASVCLFSINVFAVTFDMSSSVYANSINKSVSLYIYM